MPKPPPWIDQPNGLITVQSNTCHDLFALFIETARMPAGELVIQFLSFGLADVIRGYARPKAVRGGRHFRGGKKGGVKVIGLPEFGNEIGKNLPGAEQMSNRHVGIGPRFLWFLDGLLQRKLFQWMVVDLVTDFLFDWTSAIIEEAEKQDCNLASLILPGNSSSVLGLQGWQGIILSGTIQTNGGIVFNAGAVTSDTSGYQYILGMRVRNSGTAPAKIGLRLLSFRSPGPNVIDEVWTNVLAPGATGDLVAYGIEKSPHIIAPQLKITGGLATVVISNLYVQGGGQVPF